MTVKTRTFHSIFFVDVICMETPSSDIARAGCGFFMCIKSSFPACLCMHSQVLMV